jgi:hypothetical protein
MCLFELTQKRERERETYNPKAGPPLATTPPPGLLLPPGMGKTKKTNMGEGRRGEDENVDGDDNHD